MELEKSKFGLLNVRFILVHIFLPVLVGGLIYTFWRKPTLLVFSWYDFIGLNGLVASLRGGAQPYYPSLPEWFLFCLPDGLWVYAMTAFMAGLWVEAPKPYLLFWICLAPVLAIGGELGQFLGVVQGTYETTDIVFYLAGFILAVFVVSGRSKRENYEKHCLV
jgi:hypothetical protein